MQVDREKCGSCGACVSVCPNNVLLILENYLKIEKHCKKCNNCTIVCPLGALSNK
ncbi:MAG: 4Fe-4S binding protein [Methanomicrobiales archaeon]